MVFNHFLGLAAYLLKNIPEVKSRGVVVGHDHRHNSQRFAHLVAVTLIRNEIKCYLLHGLVATPMVVSTPWNLGDANRLDSTWEFTHSSRHSIHTFPSHLVPSFWTLQPGWWSQLPITQLQIMDTSCTAQSLDCWTLGDTHLSSHVIIILTLMIGIIPMQFKSFLLMIWGLRGLSKRISKLKNQPGISILWLVHKVRFVLIAQKNWSRSISSWSQVYANGPST